MVKMEKKCSHTDMQTHTEHDMDYISAKFGVDTSHYRVGRKIIEYTLKFMGHKFLQHSITAKIRLPPRYVPFFF